MGAAFLAKPELTEVIRGTLIPRIRFDREFLSMLVAVIGTTLSAYLYTWQSNEEVEEEIAMGRTTLAERQGATSEELSWMDNDRRHLGRLPRVALDLDPSRRMTRQICNGATRVGKMDS